MQENIKIEENPILSPTLTLDVIMKKLIDEMEKGKESAQMIRNILDDDLHQRSGLKDGGDNQDYSKTLDHHSMVVLTSFVTSLSLMKSCEFDHDQDLIKKRKVDLMDDNNDNGDVPNKILTNTSKDGRGCYKRRKSGEARVEEVTQLRDDGFNWRKYGQKVILNANHPRNYYRCTHKYDQKCLAAKQVQQISENPTKYRIIYHGNHTCNNNNILKFSPIIINDDSASDDQHHSSALVISFNEKNQENPFLFPAADSVKQEYNSDQATSQDQTATTGLSSSTLVSDLISTAENCYSSTTIQDEDVEDYSSIWTDLGMINDLYVSL